MTWQSKSALRDERRKLGITKVFLAGVIMLGIDDPWIWGVYLLCILSTLLCVVYGLINWNKGADTEAEEDAQELARQVKEEEMQEKELKV